MAAGRSLRNAAVMHAMMRARGRCDVWGIRTIICDIWTPKSFIFIGFCVVYVQTKILAAARLAQSAERKALNLVVVGSSPTVGDDEKLQIRR